MELSQLVQIGNVEDGMVALHRMQEVTGVPGRDEVDLSTWISIVLDGIFGLLGSVYPGW